MAGSPAPTTAAGQVATGPGAAPRRPARGRRGVIILLCVLLGATLGVAGYLAVATAQWQDHSAQWEATSRRLGNDVAQLRADLKATAAELAGARSQLTTAQNRITDLANEKAQLGDQNVTAQRYLDYQSRVSTAAGQVAEALSQCTTAQQQLIGYLGQREKYDPAQLETFAKQVDSLCRAATDANARLQQELDR